MRRAQSASQLADTVSPPLSAYPMESSVPGCSAAMARVWRSGSSRDVSPEALYCRNRRDSRVMAAPERVISAALPPSEKRMGMPLIW